MNAPSTRSTSLGEWLALALVTLVGGLIRLGPPGRLGLVHFDEGIYALAATWSLQPGGLWDLDSSLIPYAPPGFPILAGIFYAIFGVSDTAAIAVSLLAGTATIPVLAWLARRTFGPGAGFASAVLVALSGPHIAFSRMALTDVSFLLAWLAAIGAGIRFLERPGAGRAIAMGAAVGLAQQFKYNGWLSGGIVILAAIFGALARPEGRTRRELARVFGWGALGALVAGLVVLPWFLFVERHGGYAALLDHQRSYLVGWRGWHRSFRAQADQAVALSGDHILVVFSWALASVGAWACRRVQSPGEPARLADRAIAVAAVLTMAGLLVVVPEASWWLALMLMPWLLLSGRPGHRLVGAWWVATSAITPFYHPYARLWLPVQAADWLVMAAALANGLPAVQPYLRRLRGAAVEGDPSFARFCLAWGWGIGVGVLCTMEMETLDISPRPLGGLISPSDSLRRSVADLSAKLPPDLAGLRFYGRPTILFYLGGRVPIRRYPDVEKILRSADPNSRALIDFAMVAPRTMPDGIEDWEIDGFIQADLNDPTLLDIEPDAARNVFQSGTGKTAPLILYKAKSRRGEP